MAEMLNRKHLLFVALWVNVLVSQAGIAAEGIRAVTRPSADIVLSFVQPGRIDKVHIVEGDEIKAGQVLVQLDDAAERVQLALLKTQSEDRTQIQASEASLAQKKVDLEKLEKAAARDAATELEVEHARLDVRIAELSLALAQLEHLQSRMKYDAQEIHVDKMRLKSPKGGRIEKIHVEVGESVNVLEEVVRIVQIDPLWIDVPVPAAETTGLKRDAVARVALPATAGPSVVEGKIIFVGSVIDAASATLRICVELPNPARRPAGEHVLVSF